MAELADARDSKSREIHFSCGFDPHLQHQNKPTCTNRAERIEFSLHRYNKWMPEEKTSPLSFEASLDELERVVKELEKGDLPLEQSLALFEAGMKLSADCKRQLEEAEMRVEILIKKGSEVTPVPFSPEKPGIR